MWCLRDALFIVSILCLVGSQVSIAQPEYPRFGDSLALLNVPNTFINNVAFSSGGDYVVATANELDREFIAQGFSPTFQFLNYSQYLWHIPQYLLSGLNWLEADQHLILDKQNREILGPDFAISPDTRYLVVRTDNQMKLYRFPAFILEAAEALNHPIQRFTREQFNQVQWSVDSQLVATLDGDEIVVWDILGNEVNRYVLDKEYDRLRAVQVGWYVYTDDGDSVNGFGVCSWRLEQCSLHELPAADGYFKMPVPNGQNVLTGSGDIGSSDQNLRIWNRQHDGTYRAEDLNVPDDLQFVPIAFNNSGEYLIASLGTIGSSLDDPVNVWRFPDLTSLSTVTPIPTQYIWLPDDRHFVTFDAFWGREDWDGHVFRLYRVGREAPLDELRLPIETINGFAMQFSSTEDDLMHISTDGRRLLLKAGYGVFVIPIIYE